MVRDMKYLLIALIIDYFLGDPIKWPHPVILIGRFIHTLENRLINKKNQKLYGYILLGSVLLCIYFTISFLEYMTSFNKLINIIFTIYALYAGVAYRALIKASLEVYKELVKNDISQARVKLSYIVGRDTQQLIKEQIIKATVETVAENTIDGVIAPIFYAIIGYLIFNEPIHFIWLYKGINTLDSMVGYKNEKYKDFGYASAKCDDIVNYIPARIGSILMLFAGAILKCDFKNGFKIFCRDRYNHKSPNSAHSESVIAGLLNIQLGGEASYFGELVKKPVIGDKLNRLNVEHIKKTNLILTVTYFMIIIIVFIGEFIIC